MCCQRWLRQAWAWPQGGVVAWEKPARPSHRRALLGRATRRCAAYAGAWGREARGPCLGQFSCTPKEEGQHKGRAF